MDKKILPVIIILLIFLVWAGYFFLTNKPSNNNQNNQPVENKQINSDNFMIQNMKVEILQDGSGEAAKTGDMVTVHYIGTFENGVKFDSSFDNGGRPLSFPLGGNMVVKGWELGVLGMKVGEKRKLTVPPELGYGEAGYPGVIPPNATLIFEVELLKIN